MRIDYSSSKKSIRMLELMQLFMMSPKKFLGLDKNLVPYSSLRELTIKLSKKTEYYGIIMYYEMFLKMCSSTIPYLVESVSQDSIYFMYVINKVTRLVPIIDRKDLLKISDIYRNHFDNFKRSGIVLGKGIESSVKRYQIEPEFYFYTPISLTDVREIPIQNVIMLFIYNIKHFLLTRKNKFDWRMIDIIVGQIELRHPKVISLYQSFKRFCSATKRELKSGMLEEDIYNSVEFIKHLMADVTKMSLRRASMIGKTIPSRINKLVSSKLKLGEPYREK